METYTNYWIASMMRGAIAVLAGLAILVLPQAISLVFLLPFAILLSMMCLAAYGMVDSIIVLMTSFLIPHHESGRAALRAQGSVGVICGALLFFLVYDRAQLHWFLYLAALQAIGVAVTEFTVARGISVHDGSRWSFAAALVAGISSVVLLLGRNLEPQNLVWLLFGYVGVFGCTLCLLSARMLFAERRFETGVAESGSEALANAL
jgi:hypothetical protein